jgi:hypothetical protein
MGHVADPELSWALVAGATAMRHVVAPELPYARSRESWDTRVCAPVLPFVFDLKLVRGGIRSSGVPIVALEPTLGETANPWVGPVSFLVQPF